MNDAKMFEDIRAELARARAKFPRNQHQLAAFSEEAGELARAMLEREYGHKTDCDVYREAVQAAVTAIRVAVEGDHSFSYDPSQAVG